MNATYPKEYMSITELTKIGLPREYLRQLSRIDDAPIIRTSGMGKILFVTADLNSFIKSVSEREKKKYIKTHKTRRYTY